MGWLVWQLPLINSNFRQGFQHGYDAHYSISNSKSMRNYTNNLTYMVALVFNPVSSIILEPIFGIIYGVRYVISNWMRLQIN